MCSICGCSIDPADGSIYAKDYECLSCGHLFRASGVVVACTSCRSRNVKRAKR